MRNLHVAILSVIMTTAITLGGPPSVRYIIHQNDLRIEAAQTKEAAIDMYSSGKWSLDPASRVELGWYAVYLKMNDSRTHVTVNLSDTGHRYVYLFVPQSGWVGHLPEIKDGKCNPGTDSSEVPCSILSEDEWQNLFQAALGLAKQKTGAA